MIPVVHLSAHSWPRKIHPWRVRFAMNTLAEQFGRTDGEAVMSSRKPSEADVMLLPSNFEGMSVAVMEALAQGCCVVASRVSGLEDYERNALSHNALWLHPVGDVAAAAHCVAARGRRQSDAEVGPHGKRALHLDTSR